MMRLILEKYPVQLVNDQSNEFPNFSHPAAHLIYHNMTVTLGNSVNGFFNKPRSVMSAGYLIVAPLLKVLSYCRCMCVTTSRSCTYTYVLGTSFTTRLRSKFRF